MKIFRWWGIVAFLLIVSLLLLIGYFVAPRVIHSSIESTGSELLGAKVELESVHLTFSPFGVELIHLQATDPNQPMSNIFEADRIKMTLDADALLWKKIIIDEVQLSGARSGSPRATSGELKGGRKSSQVTQEIVDLVVPAVDNIDINQLVEKADLITLKRINQFKTEQSRIKDEWTTALDKKAIETRHQAIKAEFDRLSARAKENKVNLVNDRKAWKQLKQSIDDEKSQLAGLKEKLKQDKNTLGQSLSSIKAGPADDLQAELNKVGLDRGIDSLVDKYLGPEYTPWVKQAIEMAKSVSSEQSSPEENNQAPVVVKGNRVYFKDNMIFPEFLIKKIHLDGKSEQWSLAGNGVDIGYFPWMTGKPAKLNLDFSGNSQATFALSSDWTSPQKMRTELKADITSWQLEALQMMNTSEGQWQLAKGVVAGNIQGHLTLESIDLSAQLKIASPQLSFPESLSGWQRNLAESIAQQSSIDFHLTAKGNLSDPSIRLSSSLEKLFQDAIGKQLKQKAESLKGEIKTKISEKVGDLSKFENFSTDLEQWQSQLADKDKLLDDLKAKIKI